MDPCPGVTGNITQYQISLQTGSFVVTEDVNITECTANRCNYAFEPPSNPPSSYESVSVAAENVVGVGAARTCTTQTISEYCYFHHTHKGMKLHTHILLSTTYNTANLVIVE